MTEKEKAIEDETIELSTEPTEKKKPHRRRAVVIIVVAIIFTNLQEKVAKEDEE